MNVDMIEVICVCVCSDVNVYMSMHMWAGVCVSVHAGACVRMCEYGCDCGGACVCEYWCVW